MICVFAKEGELFTYRLLNGLQTTYKEHWRDDIDDGLRAWPSTSHRVALALFFNPDRSANTEVADEVLSDYVTRHLLSMAGAPDVVGDAARIISAIIPDFLLEPIEQLKEDILNSLLKSAIGMTKDELKEYITRPDRYFDQVMGSGSGEHITLATFNADHLKIADTGYENPGEAFDYRELPAAYNTVVLSKLVLLEPAEINRLIADLGGATVMSTPNVMLGFARTLDGSWQWRAGMVLAAECKVYEKVFEPLPGEERCSEVDQPGEGEEPMVLHFDTDSAELAGDQIEAFRAIARSVVEVIGDNFEEKFVVEGHADAVGPDRYNLRLSERRAASVASLLIRDYQVPRENLVTEGHGERRLKVPTQGPSRENRRVEVRRIVLAGQ